MDDAALGRFLSDIDGDISDLSDEIKGLRADIAMNHTQSTSEIANIRENYVKKADWDDERHTRRTILIAAVTIITSIALATWTMIASRPDPVIITELLWLAGLSLPRFEPWT